MYWHNYAPAVGAIQQIGFEIYNRTTGITEQRKLDTFEDANHTVDVFANLGSNGRITAGAGEHILEIYGESPAAPDDGSWAKSIPQSLGYQSELIDHFISTWGVIQISDWDLTDTVNPSAEFISNSSDHSSGISPELDQALQTLPFTFDVQYAPQQGLGAAGVGIGNSILMLLCCSTSARSRFRPPTGSKQPTTQASVPPTAVTRSTRAIKTSPSRSPAATISPSSMSITVQEIAIPSRSTKRMPGSTPAARSRPLIRIC